MGFYERVAKIFAGVVSFMFVIMAVYSATIAEVRGRGVNGFLVLAMFIFLTFLIIKGHPYISGIASIAISVGLKITSKGFDMDNAESLVVPVLFILLYLAFIRWSQVTGKRDDERHKRIKENRKAGIACCPICGSPSIVYFRSGRSYHCNNCHHDW